MFRCHNKRIYQSHQNILKRDKLINITQNKLIMIQNTSEVFIEKNIVLESEQTGHIYTLRMKLKYNPAQRSVNLSKAFRDILTDGYNIQNSQIFFMDFQRRVYVYLGNFPSKEDIHLGYQYMIEEELRLRYKKVQHQKQQKDQQAMKSKRKVKQRTIKQVCQSVKQWRRLYSLHDYTGRKIHTLQSAAQIVGVAKKTLDDYYSHLRYAQYFGFDFEKHKDDKIGVLRKFVKIQRKNFKGMMESQGSFVDDIWASSSDSDQDKNHPF